MIGMVAIASRVVKSSSFVPTFLLVTKLNALLSSLFQEFFALVKTREAVRQTLSIMAYIDDDHMQYDGQNVEEITATHALVEDKQAIEYKQAIEDKQAARTTVISPLASDSLVSALPIITASAFTPAAVEPAAVAPPAERRNAAVEMRNVSWCVLDKNSKATTDIATPQFGNLISSTSFPHSCRPAKRA